MENVQPEVEGREGGVVILESPSKPAVAECKCLER